MVGHKTNTSWSPLNWKHRIPSSWSLSSVARTDRQTSYEQNNFPPKRNSIVNISMFASCGKGQLTRNQDLGMPRILL